MRQSEKMREIKSNIVSRICELNKELYGYVYDKFTCDKMRSCHDEVVSSYDDAFSEWCDKNGNNN